MGKRKKSQPKKRVITRPVPQERRYVPPPCSACKARRPAGKEYSMCYATKRMGGHIKRYIRCTYCGNTWSDVERPSSVVSTKSMTMEQTGVETVATAVDLGHGTESQRITDTGRDGD